MAVVFLSLGSNIQPEQNISEAIRKLSKHVKVLGSSTVYLTEPLLGRLQPDYYNCVVKIETDLEVTNLKSMLRMIEDELGRKRTEDRYASRTVDLDILLYGNLVLKTDGLVVPSPEIEERGFLARALFDIEPELILPPINKPIGEVAEKFKDERITELREFTKTLRRLVRSSGPEEP